MAETRERIPGRHEPQDNGEHEGGEGHDVIAEPAPEEEREDRPEKAEEKRLLQRHGAEANPARSPPEPAVEANAPADTQKDRSDGARPGR